MRKYHMFTFPSFIYRQKNTLLFILLFLVVVGIFAPHITFAATDFNRGLDTGTCPQDEIRFGIPPTTNFYFACNLGITVRRAIALMLSIPLLIAGIFDIVVGTLLRIVIQATTSIKLTDNFAVVLGFGIVRDFANMLIVLALIVIAMATILRFKNYEAKQLLAKLIIVAILINFSLVICGFFIDASNIVIKYLFIPRNGVGVADNIGQFVNLRPFLDARY